MESRKNVSALRNICRCSTELHWSSSVITIVSRNSCYAASNLVSCSRTKLKSFQHRVVFNEVLLVPSLRIFLGCFGD